MEVLFDIQPEPLAERIVVRVTSAVVVIAVAVMLKRVIRGSKRPDGDQARNPLVTISGSMAELDVAFLMIDRRRGNQFHPYTSGPVDAFASTAPCLVIIEKFGVFCCTPGQTPARNARFWGVPGGWFGERPKSRPG
jgi:hypothetical protein